MATLILTTVGGAIGGPVGAAIGATLGNAVDRSILFKPKGRQGPRLTELAVQTSSYGQPIPRLYGTMRIAGSVIWATDLKESRSTSRSGKGQPKTTTYSYSASFAVLLSARAITSVGRIWADGQLLRGAAGDFKVSAGFRLHTGGEDQAPDPLIAAAEGAGLAPAMRGQAYAVFEDLQLADYGNRIPSLTFEVTADEGPVAVGDIAADLGVTADDPGSAVAGFSAYGDSVRGVLETLAEFNGGWFAGGSAAAIRMRAGPGPSVSLADQRARDSVGQRRLSPIDTVPKRLAVAHYDPTRDYQSGLQRAARPGAGHREARLELPAAMSAGTARSLAEAALARAEAAGERRTVEPGDAGLQVMPGDRVTIAGEAGVWRVTRWTMEGMTIRLELVRVTVAPVPLAATSGRVSGAPDRVHGTTILHAFELPPIDDAILSVPRLTVAAAGGPGWRQAALLKSLDGGARWEAAGAAVVPATLGTVAVPPGPANACLRDDRHVVEIELAHSEMELADADDLALDAGANLALVGDELIQFGRAVRIGPARWRLSRLWRGRRGSEWATGFHQIGERFVLVEPDALVAIDLPLAAVGSEIRLLASGVGDLASPVAESVTLTGASVAPPSPVALDWREDSAGDSIVRWTRRSRSGWHWRDGGDVPLAEESERYRIETPSGSTVALLPEYRLNAADRAGGAVTVTVRQLGTLAESRASSITVPGL